MQNPLSLPEKARHYALAQHGQIGQLYDGQPYATHLEAVARLARQHGHLLGSEADRQLALAGAYVHDIIEDCRVTYNDVSAATSAEVAEIAYLLATPKGRNRAERHRDAYYQEMAASEVATYVKICDRLANAAHSRATGGPMLARYRQENAHFGRWLRPAWPGFAPLWAQLTALLDQPA